MTTRKVELTPARRRALEVLHERHQQGRSGRISNVTGADDGTVYWQSAKWLMEQGLAEPIRANGTVYLRITQAGLDQLAET